MSGGLSSERCSSLRAAPHRDRDRADARSRPQQGGGEGPFGLRHAGLNVFFCNRSGRLLDPVRSLQVELCHHLML